MTSQYADHQEILRKIISTPSHRVALYTVSSKNTVHIDQLVSVFTYGISIQRTFRRLPPGIA